MSWMNDLLLLPYSVSVQSCFEHGYVTACARSGETQRHRDTETQRHRDTEREGQGKTCTAQSQVRITKNSSFEKTSGSIKNIRLGTLAV